MATKEQIKQKEQEIIDLARKLCKEKISEEYADLAEKLIHKLGRKREVPFILGSCEIWATAVIHKLGSINFLFDKTFLPYISPANLSAYYGLNMNTVSSKALEIEKLLNLSAFDDNFSTEYMRQKNPFNKIMLNEDGILLFNEDEDIFDEDEDDFGEDDPYLGKYAIFIRPKQPFIDWVNKLDPENPIGLENFFEGNTYLISGDEIEIIVEKDVDLLVESRYFEIAENEFLDFWTDENDWPKNFSFKDFKLWFEYHVSTIIVDLD